MFDAEAGALHVATPATARPSSRGPRGRAVQRPTAASRSSFMGTAGAYGLTRHQGFQLEVVTSCNIIRSTRKKTESVESLPSFLFLMPLTLSISCG